MPINRRARGRKHTSVCGHSNGLTFDLQGWLIPVQHDGALSKYPENKGMDIMVDSYQDKRFNSIAFAPD
ncbi:MAG TPA: hypothetical protein VJ876_01730 [Bacteroidales bacterium]|nr:hypothetical protein [Bacteroidales bacterium]